MALMALSSQATRDRPRLRSALIIMGRLITYRGTVELVFVTSSDGRVYAVDGDFGKIFWTRQIDSKGAVCPTPATPALTPNPPEADPNDDGPQPRRPLYVQAPDGVVHSLNPIDGEDDARAHRVPCAEALAVKKSEATPLKPTSVAVWKDHTGRTHRYRNAVVAGGVAFVLTRSTGELEAFDAVTGRTLYRSGPTSPGATSLAVANGHVCFSASDATLYCFGFPVDR